MCRFLMAKCPAPFRADGLLRAFADMAESSRAPDGDRQQDGWGVGWLDERGSWDVRTFLRPVWQDGRLFPEVPAGRIFLVHARSASFAGQKNNLAYNQPFTDGAYGFVFNGLLQGVSFPAPVAGEIGSQRIWTLLKERLQDRPLAESLEEIGHLLARHSRRIQALNIGLCDRSNLYAFSRGEDESGYYQLWAHESPSLKLVCSEPLAGFDFVPLVSGRTAVF